MSSLQQSDSSEAKNECQIWIIVQVVAKFIWYKFTGTQSRSYMRIYAVIYGFHIVVVVWPQATLPILEGLWCELAPPPAFLLISGAQVCIFFRDCKMESFLSSALSFTSAFFAKGLLGLKFFRDTKDPWGTVAASTDAAWLSSGTVAGKMAFLCDIFSAERNSGLREGSIGDESAMAFVLLMAEGWVRRGSGTALYLWEGLMALYGVCGWCSSCAPLSSALSLAILSCQVTGKSLKLLACKSQNWKHDRLCYIPFFLCKEQC